MNLALVSAVNALGAVTNLLNGGTLVLYSGTQPSTPETALSGNTALATFIFASPAWTTAALSGANEQQTATFSPSSVAPTQNGTVTFARATMASVAWVASTAYTVGRIVTANSNLWYCTKAGSTSVTAPSTPSPSSTDGTVQWQYLGGATQTVVADFTVGTTGTDIIIGNSVLSTTINVTITSFILQIPAV